jgi:hypothetical protein
MSDEQKPRWPKVRSIKGGKDTSRPGLNPAKQHGGALRKHELRGRSQQQLESTLNELEMYKAAHHNLAAILEGLVRIYGPQSIPIELLETHCRYGNVVMGADENQKCITVQLKPPPAPVEPPPLPEGAPAPLSSLSLREGQTFQDGKLVQEYVTRDGTRYVAEAMDELPDLG